MKTYLLIAMRTMLSASLLGVGGCMAVAAIAQKVMPDPKEPALYVPAKENLLVLVEDYQNPAAVEVIADRIDRLISNELVAEKVAPIINPHRVAILRADNPDSYRKMKIPEIGRALGARQVLYVDLTDFQAQSAVGTDAFKGLAEARVRIVDAQTGQTRWPTDATSAGFPISVSVPFSPDNSNSSESAIRDNLAQMLASRVSKLFYSASVPDDDHAPAYPETD